MCADPNEGNDERKQMRRLMAFLQPVLGLKTEQERFEKYQEVWAKISPNAKRFRWDTRMAVNYPWDGKEELWKTLRGEIETKVRGSIIAECESEVTMRPAQPFSFVDYSEMLVELLDIFLKGLDAYIDIQDHITAVSDDMDAYDEDERPMSEKSMRHKGVRKAQHFLDVILFMHAVPQRATDRWDALDLESDVTWFREHCEVYQKNEELMEFLRDCALLVLITGYFDVPKDIKTICDCYTQRFSLLDQAI
jgi:hypothetical protein